MIRLLLAVLLLGLTLYFVLGQQKQQQQSEVIYHEQMDKAEAVEQLLQDDLKRQMQAVDESSQ